MRMTDKIVRISDYPPMELRKKNEVAMLHFPAFDRIDFVIHGMSTRIGGVSKGIYAAMNFKADGEDSAENIRENYRRIAEYLGCDTERIVRPRLVHGKRVHLVEEADYGCGAVRPSTLMETDAVITNQPGVTLCATFADCVPLFFIDEKNHAIGLAHSGWRGTVQKIGLETVREMKRYFGSEQRDILAAIGPCICGDCYEIGTEVAEEFMTAFDAAEEKGILRKKSPEKYLLDLRKANEQVFLEAGILPENITISDVCTCCNPELLFSHRATRGQRGALGAFLGILNCQNK